MATFTYKAVDTDGNTQTGTMEAKSEEELFKKLNGQNLVLMRARENKNKVNIHKLKIPEIAEFSRQISEMTSSGIPITRALQIIRDCAVKPNVKNVYSRLYHDVMDGKTLSEAMRAQGNVFPYLFINMYNAGEVSGKLEDTALKMSNHYDKEHRLNSKVRSAMIYPVILLSVTVLVVLIIFTFILPQFFKLFEGMDLPAITKAVMWLSEVLTNYFIFILIGVLVIVFAVREMLKVDSVRISVDKSKLKLPKIGSLNKIIYTARFARTLSSLYSSGLSIIEALTVSSSIVGNRYIEHQFTGAIANIKNGETLSSTIGKIEGFDRKLSATLIIAEESGRLDSMLDNMANNYDYDAEMATTKMVALIEPVMIILMAVVIGFIILSVLLPLLGVYQNIGQGA